jgi:hypothetical protein
VEAAVSSHVERVQAWIQYMAALRSLPERLEDERRRYVEGEITVEAFEARVSVLFGLSV